MIVTIYFSRWARKTLAFTMGLIVRSLLRFERERSEMQPKPIMTLANQPRKASAHLTYEMIAKRADRSESPLLSDRRFTDHLLAYASTCAT